MSDVMHPVYLVRHGQSEWNLRRLTQGQIAHPRLTELGRAQAVAAADVIARDVDAQGLSVTRVVTSDLVRARETAEVLAARLGGELVLDARLREQHLGSLEGCGYDETWAAAARIDWSDPTVPIAGGESLMNVYQRMAAVIEEVKADAVSVLVSHGDSIRAVLAYLRGVQPHESTWVDVPNGAVLRCAGQLAWLAPDVAARRSTRRGSSHVLRHQSAMTADSRNPARADLRTRGLPIGMAETWLLGGG